jgi:GxxExxY protein
MRSRRLPNTKLAENSRGPFSALTVRMPLDLTDPISRITNAVIAAAIEVHRELGPGLLESAYQECLAYEFVQRGIAFSRNAPLPVVYRSVKLDCGYRLDFFVERRVVVEVKSVERLAPIHSAQVITYLKLMECPVGLLVNFNVTSLRQGLRRLENRVHREIKRLGEPEKGSCQT